MFKMGERRPTEDALEEARGRKSGRGESWKVFWEVRVERFVVEEEVGGGD